MFTMVMRFLHFNHLLPTYIYFDSNKKLFFERWLSEWEKRERKKQTLACWTSIKKYHFDNEPISKAPSLDSWLTNPFRMKFSIFFLLFFFFSFKKKLILFAQLQWRHFQLKTVCNKQKKKIWNLTQVGNLATNRYFISVSVHLWN